MSNDLRTLLDLDDEDLYGRLGETLLSEGRDFGSRDLAEFAEFGRRWVNDRTQELRATICGRPEVAAIQDGPAGDLITEAATLTDVISALYGKPAAGILAVILLRRGLNVLCNSYGNDRPAS
uniref:hypothetical protein n=1 Tax=Nonomuraea sp. CA-252377 TaxID=3240003 RepID=UPI003F49843C